MNEISASVSADLSRTASNSALTGSAAARTESFSGARSMRQNAAANRVGPSGSTACGHQPRPVANKIFFIEGESERTPELVVGEAAVAAMIQASEEPATVLGVDKVAFGRARVVLSGYRVNLRGAVAGRGLTRPHAHLPSIVKDEAVGAAVLENSVVVFILIEFHATVESRAVLGVSVVALSGALQHGLAVLTDGSDATLAIDDAHHTERREGNTWRLSHRCERLSLGQQILFQRVNDQLSRLAVQ